MPLSVYPLPLWNGRQAVITSHFGEDRDGGARSHQGSDIMYWRIPTDTQPVGHDAGSKNYVMLKGSPVISAGDGVCIESKRGGTGYNVKISHPGGLVTVYRHLISGSVSVAQRVKAGQVVGNAGASPKGANPVHLHFEVLVNGIPVNPAPYIQNLQHVKAPNSFLFIALVVVAGVYVARQWL